MMNLRIEDGKKEDRKVRKWRKRRKKLRSR